jgi:hypothetical protein
MHEWASTLCQNGKKAYGVVDLTGLFELPGVLFNYLLEGGVCVCLVLRTYDSVNAMNVRNLDWWELCTV